MFAEAPLIVVQMSALWWSFLHRYLPLSWERIFVIYYKQISEGEDRERFIILQKSVSIKANQAKHQ